MTNEVFTLRKRIQELEQALLPFASIADVDSEGNEVSDIKASYIGGAGFSIKYVLGVNPKKVLSEAKLAMVIR